MSFFKLIVDFMTVCVFLWFFLSIIIFFIDNINFYNELKKSGVRIDFMYTGIPYYVLSRYLSCVGRGSLDLSEIDKNRVHRHRKIMANLVRSTFAAFLWGGVVTILITF